MNEDRQHLQSYLSGSSDSKKKSHAKPNHTPADKDELADSSSAHSSPHPPRKATADEGKQSPKNTSPDGLTNVSPPPELGDNLNA